jgi:hypothetical protein
LAGKSKELASEISALEELSAEIKKYEPKSKSE